MSGAAPRGAVATEESAGAIRPCTSPTEVAQAAWRASGTATAGAVRAGRKTTGKSAESETAASLWSGRILATSPGSKEPRTCRADAAPHDGRRPGRGQEGAGCQRRFPVINSTQYGLFFRTGRPRRRGRGSSESPAPLRGREANARPRHAGLPGPAGRHRAAGPGRARAGPDRNGAGRLGAEAGGHRRRRAIPADVRQLDDPGRDSRPISPPTTPSSAPASAAGVTAMQTYADDFTALVSTESVNARTNTLTRATDTDVPIYWVKNRQLSLRAARCDRRLRGPL